MKAPAFWTRRGIAARLLAPAGRVTAALTRRRLARAAYDPGIPVICVGNAGIGGAGKTIVALDLLERLPGRVFALTRGYRGRLAGPVRVTAAHDAADVGDEAKLLAEAAPTIVARDRAAGARLALEQGATAIVLDDGLQNPALRKTLSLLVIDGGYGFGNQLLLPAGPLREPVAAAAARCGAAVLIGADRHAALPALPAGLPVLRASLVASCAITLHETKVLAFAGIGRPEKFFESAAGLGARFAAQIPFPDHHHYTPADAERLLRLATASDAVLLTTAKDFVKLPAPLRARTAVLRVRLRWADETALSKILAAV